VDDNPADVGLVREALEEHSVQGDLTVVFDGDQAIQFIKEIDSQSGNCPDLIILDLNLPKKPGREVLECVRQSSKCRESPVVILTSSDERDDQDDAIRLGADRYIRKPSSLEEFIALGAIFKALLAGSGK
jgi:DNA-binding response OmpR family regulator